MREAADYTIEEFAFGNELPYRNRLFFIQHLIPYLFFSPQCKNLDVLEIGTGQGYGSYYLSKKAKSVTGIDLNFSTAGLVKRYQDRYRRDNIDFVCADGVQLPFTQDSFDRVITCQVIEHIPEDKLILFLEEICRVLKDGGVLLVSTLNIEHNLKNIKTYEKYPEHHKEFTRDELYILLKNIFPRVDMYGLNISFRHRFFLRLKRWGFLQYNFFGANPVRSFFENIAPGDFKVSTNISRRSSDFFALCYKK